MSPERKRSNQRLGWALAAIAALVFAAFVLKGALGGL
ncbi:MAG: cytochrome oxidase small assembly protein [Rhizobacter sp.]|nr:cytochrome oxidase small assembly protein [Rhizobacter sp.]